jgi:hypothetical protein
MFLHVLGYNRRFRVIHNTWRKSTEIISHYFKQVLFAIGELREKMIKLLSTHTPTKIKDNYQWFPYFKVSNSTSFCITLFYFSKT